MSTNSFWKLIGFDTRMDFGRSNTKPSIVLVICNSHLTHVNKCNDNFIRFYLVYGLGFRV